VEATALHTQETRAAFRVLAPEQSITTTSCSGALLLPGAGAVPLLMLALLPVALVALVALLLLLLLPSSAELSTSAMLPLLPPQLPLLLTCCEGPQSCRRSATPFSMCVTVALANASAAPPRHSLTARPSAMRSTGLPLASVPCQLIRWL
jgi:hypothetical protein